MRKDKRIDEIMKGLLLVFIALVSILCCAENIGAVPANLLVGFESITSQIAPEVKLLSRKPCYSPDLAKVPPSPDVLAEFDQVKQSISGLATLGKYLRTSLIQKLTNAQAAYRRGQPCTALNVLGAYLNETQALRRGSLVSTAEQLFALGHSLRRDLVIHLPEGIRCSGTEWINNEVSVEVLESDNTHVRGRITFGEPIMQAVTASGETFTKVTIPGYVPAGQAGLPGVPTVGRLVAFTRGADVSVSTSPPVFSEILRVNLYPFQSDPADAEVLPDPFGDWPFAKDEKTYASQGPFPSEICTFQRLGQVRDLPIMQLSCAAGQYNPVSDTLRLFRSVDFDVRFTGGSGFFVTEDSFGPFEQPLENLTGILLNKWDIFHWVDLTRRETQCSGEELLIFTAPGLVEAAEELAQWKRTKGIATTVITVGTFWTAENIRLIIDDHYDHCKVRPRYVLLFGDAELIPTFYEATDYAPSTGSDYKYAVYPLDKYDVPIYNILPSFGIGRIPVDTLQQAWNVVNKIIHYENNPPDDSAFYQNVTIGSNFQCCNKDVLAPIPTGWEERGFIQTSEFVRNMLQGKGYTVQRIYTKTINPDYGKTGKDTTPKFYYDGTALPQDLKASSGFAWDGSAQDLIDAFNAGRFLIMQRDHGSWNRWVNPEMTKDDVDTYLTNGELLPVVFSISCSTGYFDNETNPSAGRFADCATEATCNYYPYGPTVTNETYFAERLLRKADGGAVGVIAATRDSPSWASNNLTRGLVDAVWPGFLKIYYPGGPIQRLGDILNHAKLTLFQQELANVDVNGQSDIRSELFLWHVIGDPTLEMWTSEPLIVLSPNPNDIIYGDKTIRVTYDVEGATITALQVRFQGDGHIAKWEMRPVGRARVTNGVATLDFVNEPWSDVPILLSASKANAVSVLLNPNPPCTICDVK